MPQLSGEHTSSEQMINRPRMKFSVMQPAVVLVTGLVYEVEVADNEPRPLTRTGHGPQLHQEFWLVLPVRRPIDSGEPPRFAHTVQRLETDRDRESPDAYIRRIPKIATPRNNSATGHASSREKGVVEALAYSFIVQAYLIRRNLGFLQANNRSTLLCYYITYSSATRPGVQAPHVPHKKMVVTHIVTSLATCVPANITASAASTPRHCHAAGTAPSSRSFWRTGQVP